MASDFRTEGVGREIDTSALGGSRELSEVEQRFRASMNQSK